MNKIEASGCTQSRVLGRGIRVGILCLLAILLLAGAASAGIYKPGATIETISAIPVTSIVGKQSTTVLTLNTTYVIKISGAWIMAGGTYIDALYGVPAGVTYVPYMSGGGLTVAAGKYTGRTVTQYLDAGTTGGYPDYPNVSNSRRIDPNTGDIIAGTYNTSNIYYFYYIGEGSVINIYLVDNKVASYYGDNSGSFTAVIYDVLPSEVTISCPAASWCYVASNYSSITLLSLNNSYPTATIQGFYGNVSKKYVNHRTGYAFNENQTVTQGQGIYYYFTSPQDVEITIPSSYSINLVTGWNLISNFGANRTLSTLATSITYVTAKQRYNATTKKWVDDDLDTVKQGESFFAYTSQNVTWTS